LVAGINLKSSICARYDGRPIVSGQPKSENSVVLGVVREIANNISNHTITLDRAQIEPFRFDARFGTKSGK